MNNKKLGLVGIMFLLLLGLVGCDKSESSLIENEEFRSYVNTENIDKTIPLINEFLAGLSNNLNDEQKLQALSTWLKSCPGITDATVLCVSCIYTLPAQSEILVSFKENGITKDLTLDISMSNPLKAIRYHEH